MNRTLVRQTSERLKTDNILPISQPEPAGRLDDLAEAASQITHAANPKTHQGRILRVLTQKNFQIICSVFDVGVHISMTW